MQRQQSTIDVHLVWPANISDMIATTPRRRTAVLIELASSADFSSLFLDSGLAIDLVRAGAVLFSLVGNDSEQAHDTLDWTLEEIGADEVVTSWHAENDLEDVASFVIASCHASNLGRLFAVIDESKELGSKLKECVFDAIRAYATS